MTNWYDTIVTNLKTAIEAVFVKKSNTTGLLKNDGTVDTSTKEVTSNKTSSWNTTTNNTRYPTEKLVKDSLDGKANTSHTHSNYLTSHQDISGKLDKAQGSTNASKNVVTDSNGNITTEAKPTIPTKTSQLTNDSNFLTSHQDISGKANKSGYSASKNLVTDSSGQITTENKPTIPTKTSQLTNDSNFLTSHQDISGKENTSNKSSSISTDTGSTSKYPTVKAVEDYAQPKGNYLTSHQDISGKADKSGYTANKNLVTNSSGQITTENKPTIPSKTSQLTNDSGFLTSHQDISGKADKSGYTASKNLVTNSSGTITTEDKPTIPSKTSQLTNDSGFLTSHQDISSKIDTAGTGLSKSGTTLNHSNSVTALTTASLKKVKYDAQGHITGTSNVVKADITGLGIPSSDTTYSTATQSANGLMSSTDKTKLDGIATSANNYSHPATHDASIIKDSTAHSNIGSSANDTQATINTKIDTALSGKQAAGSYASSTHNHDGVYLKTHQSLDSKTVTVEKQTTAETGYIATYIVKQNGSQVGEKINIPKDYLVKSASLKTCTTANSPLTGLAVNDPYLDFVVNTKDSSGTDEHIYINVKDLVDTYTAGTGLTLSNGAFSVNYGTSGTTACAGNDSRLSNARTPTAHTHTKSEISDFPSTMTPSSHTHTKSEISDFPSTMTPSSHTHGNLTNDGKIGSTSGKPLITTTSGKVTTGSFGTSSGTFCQGNDSRLSNARTPTAHTHTKSEISDFPTSMTPTSHAATSTTYGGGTASNYGHVKLSDSYTSSDGAASASVGASSKAVSDSYGTLSTIKENKYGFWYGNSSSNGPTWALHNREDPLKIKQNTPIKIFVYTMTPNGHDNVCNLGESVQYLFAKIVINDTIYTQYMNTETKTINIPISWNPGVSGNMTIHVFWGEWNIGSDIIRFTVVDNYS